MWALVRVPPAPFPIHFPAYDWEGNGGWPKALGPYTWKTGVGVGGVAPGFRST